jgi:hypothetical protein
MPLVSGSLTPSPRTFTPAETTIMTKTHALSLLAA